MASPVCPLVPIGLSVVFDYVQVITGGCPACKRSTKKFPSEFTRIMLMQIELNLRMRKSTRCSNEIRLATANKLCDMQRGKASNIELVVYKTYATQ
jgi:hypothetical protein